MLKCACSKTAKEIKLSGSTVFRGRIMNVEEDSVLLPSGRTSVREVVRTADSVSMGIRDEAGKVCLIRQFRYPAGKLLWEIPAGRIEQGESPEEAAIRESGEETGLSCEIVGKVAGFYLAAGFATEYMHMFEMRVTGLSQAKPDEDEAIEVHFLTLEEISILVDKGEIEDSKTLIYLNMLFRRPGL